VVEQEEEFLRKKWRMVMNLEKLFEMQKQLDERIVKKKGLEEQDLFPNTVLALQVELGEFANEGRWFKHWSDDQEPRENKEHLCPHCSNGIYTDPWGNSETCDSCFGEYELGVTNPLLEEYVDCLHFFLSIAIQKGWEDTMYLYADPIEEAKETGLDGGLTGIFLELHYFLNKSYMEKHPQDKEIAGFQVNAYWFRMAWYLFITIGLAGFNFSLEQIEEAYLEKNKVNHMRQENGY
jgi:dimeric dUTPase (all-alpha-NTP-PPase superfamily)